MTTHHTITLPKNHISLFQNSKNLLAFSAGIDSSALFFLLVEYGISFDIALVNYATRPTSNLEAQHANALAQKYELRCFITQAPQFESHFEAEARKFRYGFFEEIIDTQGYDTLLTAHQLNDQLEWFLMRLSKGAGVSELIGLEPITQRRNYQLVRPLLEYSKAQLLEYLTKNNHPYFVDASNSDMHYERNRFRATFSDQLIATYQDGITRSLYYLRHDKIQLAQGYKIRLQIKELYIITLHAIASKVRAVDAVLKQSGYLLSAAQREEIKHHPTVVIGGIWAIVLEGMLLYIAPYCKPQMPKPFKEQCRLWKIPPKIRGYLYDKTISPQMIQSLIK